MWYSTCPTLRLSRLQICIKRGYINLNEYTRNERRSVENERRFQQDIQGRVLALRLRIQSNLIIRQLFGSRWYPQHSGEYVQNSQLYGRAESPPNQVNKDRGEFREQLNWGTEDNGWNYLRYQCKWAESKRNELPADPRYKPTRQLQKLPEDPESECIHWHKHPIDVLFGRTRNWGGSRDKILVIEAYPRGRHSLDDGK